MDFLDYEGEQLYFDDPVSQEVADLLDKASDLGRDDSAENYLLRAYFLEPEHLTVLVALYRFYYYKQRYEDALVIADRSLDVSASLLGLRDTWQEMNVNELGHGVLISMGLTRFYMHALKASGFVLLRMQRIDEALLRLYKLTELDPQDQFGALPLIDVAINARDMMLAKDTAAQKVGRGLSAV
jgi:tetratricopeptide (TPR) repeat protein